MSFGSKAGMLLAFAISALPLTASAYPVAGPGAQEANATSAIVKAGCYYDCCNGCDCCGGRRYWGPSYWRPRYDAPGYYGPGYYFHSRYYSHYRWGSYHRLWRPHEGWYD